MVIQALDMLTDILFGLPKCLYVSLPASLRVSSLSVVKSDHSSICVSWKPLSAVDGYRIVIQSVNGKVMLYLNQ